MSTHPAPRRIECLWNPVFLNSTSVEPRKDRTWIEDEHVAAKTDCLQNLTYDEVARQGLEDNS